MKHFCTESVFRSNVTLCGLALVVLIFAFTQPVRAQGSSEEFWPSAKLTLELWPKTAVQVLGEKQSSDDISRTQRKLSVIGSYRVRRIVSVLEGDIDEEKNHQLVLAGGYEYLDTDDSGKFKEENRLVVQGTPNYTLSPLKLLIQDRNRIEFRWVSGTYSTRYRNKLTLERPLKSGQFRITPYTSGELFYDGQHESWDENQYAFGLIWPFKKLLSVDAYYLRQNCTTCKETHVNAVGVTVTIFWKLLRKERKTGK